MGLLFDSGAQKRRFSIPALALLIALPFVSGLAQAQSFNSKNFNYPKACAAGAPDYTFDAQRSYTPGNAFLALLAATIAEDWTDAGIKKDLAAFGFTDTHLIGKILAGSYGYITESKDFRILAFRGTHSIHEGVIDLTAGTLPLDDIGIAGRSHAGMKLSFKVLWELTKNELAARQKADPKPLLIVGHSLGGSIALLHAMKLKQAGFPILGLYTFAQPRIGDAAFMAQAQDLVGDRYYRMENAIDPVPHLPPTKTNAKAFAEVFAPESSQKFATIETTVENLNYAPLPGWVQEITADGFVGKQGDPAEYESELKFLNDFKKTMVQSELDNDVAAQLTKAIYGHIGDSYVCGYINLLQKGYHALSPNE